MTLRTGLKHIPDGVIVAKPISLKGVAALLVSCTFLDENVCVHSAQRSRPRGLVRMKLMSAVFQLARWCVPHRAFKGDFQRCQWMHFAGLSSGYWTFYYYSAVFGSIDLDVIVMLCWDHFKLETFQIITQPISDSSVFDITLQLQDIFIFTDFLLLVCKLLYSFSV